MKETQPISTEINDQKVENEIATLMEIGEDADQAVQEEISDFCAKRTTLAMWLRYEELNRHIIALSEQSPERKQLQRRVRRLQAYLEPPYSRSKPEQDRMILNFARSLIEGTIGKQGCRVETWEGVRQLTDEFAEHVRTLPKGRPVDYRPRVLEAMEIRRSDPKRTWASIREQLKLPMPQGDFMRQIRLLKALLRQEHISLHQ